MFGEIWERDGVRAFLTSYVREGTFHPLILTGEEGMGKQLFSRLIFKYANCEGNQSSKCECASCISIPREDYILYELEKKSWGVNDIREISAAVSKPPLASKVRAIVIDQADKITPEGSDVFLKIVEDVKPYNLFLFLTPYHTEVIPTLRSRCWEIYIPPTSEAEYGGIPLFQLNKSRVEQERAILFIESFFEKETLLNLLKVRETDLGDLIHWVLFVLHLHFTESSPYVQERLSLIEEKRGSQDLLVIYNHLNQFYQTMKRYPSVRAWHHFFQAVVDAKIELRK